MELNVLLELLLPVLAIVGGYFMLNSRITQLENKVDSGVQRLSNEHTSHDSKLVAGITKFEENVEKSFERNDDKMADVGKALMEHICEERVARAQIVTKCSCGSHE